jgi:hypothetical protein
MDILNSYINRPTDTHQDFDEVAGQVPAATLGGGLAEAFRSDRTPAFGDMASRLFGGSSPEQKAGLLEQLAGAVGPAIMSTIAGGALGRFMQGRSTAAAAQAPAADVAQVSEEQVREIANAAQQSDPGVLDRVGSYYAQHPQVIKALGGAALAILLGQIANRMKA